MADDNPDEWEFDDPRWLASAEKAAPPAAAPLTYAERRKRDLAKSQERMRQHQQKESKAGRREREEEVRLEGLATNLIAKETEEGRESKAMRMMKQVARSMGFKPGQSLGKQDEPPVASTSTAPPSTGSTPSASPAPETAPSAFKRRTEPLEFRLREARTGLGVPSSRPTRKLPPELIAAAAAAPLPSTDSFLTRMHAGMDDRRAHGLLRSARRTCEELDRRAGVEDSPMWRDPEEKEAEERKAKRRKIYDRADEYADEEEAEDEGKRKKGALGYETGLSEVVVDEDEESEDAKAARQEEEDWFSMDTATRLGLTLAYLRRTYSYCFWCGCAYDDKADLDANCPGEDEGAH